MPERLVPAALPDTMRHALGRGIRGRCARCGDGRLFARYLKPVATCPACGQDWTRQSADDFPAYIAILIAGHVLSLVFVPLWRAHWLPDALFVALLIPAVVGLTLALLQPAKGGVIAAQWWLQMNGFRRG